MRPHDTSVLTQMMQVFVYEESDDPVNAGNNGTLKLIKSIPEGNYVTANDLHHLRKEFV